MANEIYIPFLNPVKFYEIEPEQLPQYLTNHFDDYLFTNQQKSFETPVDYTQKFQINDAVKFQFESNFAAIQMEVITCTGASLSTAAATQVRINKYLPGYFVYEITHSWAAFDAGRYFFKLTLGGGAMIMISEPIDVAEEWPNTILFEYYNSRYHADVIFETGIIFGFRCEAFIGRLEPGNERVGYRDQKLNPTVLKSIPYRLFKLQIGYPRGVPDWVIDKMNFIWSCDNVALDGKSFAVNEDAKFEAKDIDTIYPMRPWSLTIQEGVNRYSKIVNPEVDVNKKLIAVGMVDSTIFGDLSEQAGSNLVQINSIE